MCIRDRLVGALAVDFDRGESGWLLEDPSRESFEGRLDVTRRQRARIPDGFALGLGVVGRGGKAQVDVGDVRFREPQGELGETRCRLEEDREHAGGEWVEGAGMADTCLLYTSDAADDLTRVDL